MRLRDLLGRGNRPATDPQPDRQLDERTEAVAEYDAVPAVGDATVPDDPRQTSFTEHFTDPERDNPEPGPARGVEDPRWARAVELRGEFNRAMTLENTPAAFASDAYDYSDDVWCDELYSTPGSVRLEQELGAHVRAHPELFTGTEFEEFARVQDEHGEDHDRPPETEGQEPDDGPRRPTPEAATWRDVIELDDDEFDAPF